MSNVTHQPVNASRKRPMSGAERQARYRAKDRAAYRRHHREYMRTWRAGRRTPAQGQAA